MRGAILYRAPVFVTGDSISMMMDSANHNAPTFVIELPKRLHLRGRWEMTIHGALNATARWCQGNGWRGIAGCIRRLQDWLHRQRFARFPKDTALLHRSLYQAGLAHPVHAFDPTAASYALRPRDIEALAVLLDFSGAHGDDLALLRLLLGAVGDDDPSDLLFALFDALYDDAVV